MSLVARQVYGKGGGAINTFIGGQGAVTTTAAALATLLGISSTRITKFSITSNNISCRITGAYSIPSAATLNNTYLTYYTDSENLVTSFYNFYGCVNLVGAIDFKGVVTYAGETALQFTQCPLLSLPNLITASNQYSFQREVTSFKEEYYIPICTSLATPTTATCFFGISSGSIIYCHPSLATINSGGVHASIAYAITQGAIIRYVTNFTAPSPVTTLASGTIYNTAVQLNFTPPSSTNAIDYYKVFVNGVYSGQRITASGQFVFPLAISTAYDITLIAVDIFKNESTVSNLLTVSTNTTEIPLSGVVSSYYLDSNSNDNVSGNNGVDTSVSYGAGKINNCAIYNGSTSKSVIGNPVNLQLSSGTISCWVKTSGAGSSYRGIFGKSNAYELLFNNNVLVTYSWGASSEKSTGVNLADGNWHHIVMIFDSGVTNGTKIYIDNVLKLTTTLAVLNQTLNFAIGVNEYSGTTHYLNGSVDGCIVCNTKASEMEIWGVYNRGMRGLNAI